MVCETTGAEVHTPSVSIVVTNRARSRDRQAHLVTLVKDHVAFMAVLT